MCYAEDANTNALYVLVGGNSKKFHRFNIKSRCGLGGMRFHKDYPDLWSIYYR